MLSECMSAFGVPIYSANVTRSATVHVHTQQVAARRPHCSCHCYKPPEHCLHKALKFRRPPVKCAAWGRKRNRPPNSGEDSNSKPSTSSEPPVTENGDSEPVGPADPRKAGVALIDDVDKIEAAAATLKKQTSATKPKHTRGAAWEDWEDWDPDWEDDSGDLAPPDQFRRVNPRRGMGSKTPRDEYLRPMIDTLGIQYRLGFKQVEAEERVQTEFETNQWESREAVKFAGMHFSLASPTSPLTAVQPLVSKNCIGQLGLLKHFATVCFFPEHNLMHSILKVLCTSHHAYLYLPELFCVSYLMAATQHSAYVHLQHHDGILGRDADATGRALS